MVCPARDLLVGEPVQTPISSCKWARTGFASSGVRLATAEDPGLTLGVNVAAGQVTYQGVAEAVGLPYVPVGEALRAATATTA